MKKIFCILISMILIVCMVPCAAFAQDNGGKKLVSGTDIPKGATLRLPIDNSSEIITYKDAIVDYKGTSCIDYQVLDTQSNTKDSNYMFITSKYTLANVIMLTDDRRAKWPEGDEFANYYRGWTNPNTGKWEWELDENGNKILANTYQGSGIHKWCQDYEEAVPGILRGSLLSTYKQDKIDKESEEICYFGESKLIGDKVFIPSVEEVTDETLFEKYQGRVADGASPWWWTRSPEGEISQCEGVVNDDGALIFNDEHVDFNSMRPSMNISKNMIFENIGDNVYTLAKAVQFHPNGGKWNDGSTDGKMYDLREKETMPSIAQVIADINQGKNPIREGYKFLGWGLSENADPSEIIDVNTEVSSNETYYAVWEKLPTPTPTPDPDKPGSDTGNQSAKNTVDSGDNNIVTLIAILGMGVAAIGSLATFTITRKNKKAKR